MFNRSDVMRNRAARSFKFPRLLGAAIAIIVPSAGISGISTEARPEQAITPREAPPRGGASASTTYQIRCWQFGRLVFEENDVILDDGHYAHRIRGRNQKGLPVVVAETKNATCLIKNVPETRRTEW